MSQQSAFTILAPLAATADSAAVLRALAALDAAWARDRANLLLDYPELHYASLALVDRVDARYVTFEGNLDGEIAPFFAKLARAWRRELEAVFAGCEGFASGSLVEYFAKRDAGPGTWYVALRGRSAVSIRNGEALHRAIDGFLCSARPPGDAVEIRAAIQAFVRGPLEASQPEIAEWAQREPERLPLLLRGNPGWPLASLAGLALGVLALLAWLAWRFVLLRYVLGGAAAVAAFALVVAILYLRRLEQRAPAGSALRSPAILREVAEKEDRFVTNHMIGVTRIQRGWFRIALLRLVLAVIGLAHRLYFNRGELGGIPTIHFARWVIRKQSRDLVFFSNYDQSWEGYLGDFIDKASIGLNAVWSNTETYPRTRFLVQGGAVDEPRFKAFGRNTMVPTRVWVAAYPNLSVEQIRVDESIRRGLFADLDAREVAAWLRLF